MEFDVRPLLVSENHDGNLAPGQILLVANVLIRGQKQIVARWGWACRYRTESSSVRWGFFEALSGEVQNGFDFLFRHIQYLGDLPSRIGLLRDSQR